MRRREFLGVLSGAAAWPVVARAQPTEPMRRVGVLLPFAENDVEGQARLKSFAQAFSEFGWVEGRNFLLERRWPISDQDQMQKDAAELVSLNVEAVLVNGPRALAAMQRQTTKIPIIFVGVSDPVGAKFVPNLARPGGNITGFSLIEFSVIGKALEILKQCAPNITRVVIMLNPGNTSADFYLRSFDVAAQRLSLQPFHAFAREPSEIASAMEALSAQPNGGLLVPPDINIAVHRTKIVELAARLHLPAMYSDRVLVMSGGLMYYGADRYDQFRRAASYVNRVLKGENVGDLPVQQPTKFELVINSKAAKALGLLVPPSLLAQADEVIE